MTKRRKRLIEVAFPLEEVSEHSRREKNVRQGHISTLHIWWARRPLAACRAFIYESLIDDPGDDTEREELLKEVADLASWDAVRHPERVVRAKEQGGSGLTGKELLDRARKRILDCNGGKPPRLLDPFAGGGAIPLEALRLGCEVEASDLNPVAVLILKATAEYPQKYNQPNSRPVPGYIHEAEKQRESGQQSFFDGDLVEAYRKSPLTTDVRYWGNWMLERAREELAEFYPPDPDGSVPVAYLWSRTVPCPNCKAEMPLLRQYWLAQRANKKVALSPVLDRRSNRVTFEIVQGDHVRGDPREATATLGDTICLLCRQVLKNVDVRRAAKAGQMRAEMTAVVLQAQGPGGKRYRPPNGRDRDVYEMARRRLNDLRRGVNSGISLVPDEPMPTRAETTGGVVSAFGLDEYGKLFNDRQLLAITTFARLVSNAHDEMQTLGLPQDLAGAVTTYLALAVDRLADYNSALSRWGNDDEGVTNTFGRQALPMVWDYGEANAIGRFGGSWESLLGGQLLAIPEGVSASPFSVSLADARTARSGGFSACITDPPYYDAINYAHLSDFFFVWLKRSLQAVHPDLLSLPLTPKARSDRDERAEQQFSARWRKPSSSRTSIICRGYGRRVSCDEGECVERSRSGRRICPHRSGRVGDTDRRAPRR